MKPVVAWKLDDNDITSGGSYVVGDVTLTDNTAGAVLTIKSATDKNTLYSCLVTSTEWMKYDEQNTVILKVYGNNLYKPFTNELLMNLVLKTIF